jgi:hypothetical protein
MIGQVEKRKVNEPVRIAAVAAAVGFFVQAAFQAALALGAPLGSASWGGTYEGQLPMGLRIASGVAVFFYVLFALIVAGRVSHLATALWRPEMGNMGARRPDVFGSAPTIRVLERLGALWLGTLFTDIGRAVPLCGA